jgi:death-on-curing protein
MKSPMFLRLAEVLAIHEDQIHRYGGAAGVRDVRLLISALAMPAASYAGQRLHGDLHEMAAAYLFHLVQNHAFVDGNNRVGAVAPDVFLSLNDVELVAKVDEYADLVLGVASGQVSKSSLVEFFRGHTVAHRPTRRPPTRRRR